MGSSAFNLTTDVIFHLHFSVTISFTSQFVSAIAPEAAIKLAALARSVESKGDENTGEK